MEEKLTRHEREMMHNRQTILQTAIDLFMKQGYENTAMDEISKVSEYTKRTVYRYFPSKEDLYFAVLYESHKVLLEDMAKRICSPKIGIEKIKVACGCFYDFYKNNRPIFDMMGQMKAIRSKKDTENLPNFQRYTDCVVQIHKLVIDVFSMAHDDKTIRTDINAKELGFSAIFVLEGFLHMLNLMGDRFTMNFGLDEEKFAETTMTLIFQIFKE